MKEKIEAANPDKCLQSVKNLPLTRFKYKDFTGTHLDKHVTGFLAENVKKVFPKAVQTMDVNFPVLDENGEQVYEEVFEDELVDEEYLDYEEVETEPVDTEAEMLGSAPMIASQARKPITASRERNTKI